MSTYLVKGKGWRYDFQKNKVRYSDQWFKTKEQAKIAESDKRKELIKEAENVAVETTKEDLVEARMLLQVLMQHHDITPTLPDMDFKTLASLRLDFLEDSNGKGRKGSNFIDTRYLLRRLSKEKGWGNMACSELTQEMIKEELKSRKENCSVTSANKDLRLIKALFNFGVNHKHIHHNPAAKIKPYPKDTKGKKYRVPSEDDLNAVIETALEDSDDDYEYIIVHRETCGRTGEINDLEWDDVDFQAGLVTLYTRKKKGGSLTPRDIDMTPELKRVLTKRYEKREPGMSHVFYHCYWSRKEKGFIVGPFGYRNKFMARLCKAAGVQHFNFHEIRRLGASIMCHDNIPLIDIKEKLGHASIKTTELYIRSLKGVRHVAIHGKRKDNK